MSLLSAGPPLVVLLLVLATILIVISRHKRKTRDLGGKLLGKGRDYVLREATRTLSQNPRDPEALYALAEIHFAERDFEKALKEYAVLIELCSTNRSIDEYQVTVRHALSALNTGDREGAYKGLVLAKSLKDDGFEVNYNLGHLEYERKNYERALSCLSAARVVHPDHPGTLKYLGLSLYRLKRYAESAALLHKALDLEPSDKEAMFALARSYHEGGQVEQALRIFSHLRADPETGPNAALFAGTIHLRTRQYDQAKADFEIGLRHPKMKPELRLELKYRLAATFIKQEEIPKAISILQEIYEDDPDYKDVQPLLGRYRELNTDVNLRTYLISQTSDFVTLCRKIAIGFFPDARVKVTDVSIQKAEYADILADVVTPKSEETILFRFVRTNGMVGELILRDLYSRIKEVRATRGLCLSAGTFSEGAQRFVEARLIDLVDKERLISHLKLIAA